MQACRSPCQGFSVSTCLDSAVELAANQWHSKALRGPGSTVTWGPPFPSPQLPPSPFPSSSAAQPLPLPRSSPQIQQGGMGSALSSSNGVWGRAPAEIEFGAF